MPSLVFSAISAAFNSAFFLTKSEQAVVMRFNSFTRLGLTSNVIPKSLRSFFRCGEADARINLRILFWKIGRMKYRNEFAVSLRQGLLGPFPAIHNTNRF